MTRAHTRALGGAVAASEPALTADPGSGWGHRAPTRMPGEVTLLSQRSPRGFRPCPPRALRSLGHGHRTCGLAFSTCSAGDAGSLRDPPSLHRMKRSCPVCGFRVSQSWPGPRSCARPAATAPTAISPQEAWSAHAPHLTPPPPQVRRETETGVWRHLATQGPAASTRDVTFDPALLCPSPETPGPPGQPLFRG